MEGTNSSIQIWGDVIDTLHWRLKLLLQ